MEKKFSERALLGVEIIGAPSDIDFMLSRASQILLEKACSAKSNRDQKC